MSSKLHNNIWSAHQLQNWTAQQDLVESVSAANVFAQLYRIKLLLVKNETKLTDECDRQLKHASETLLLLTDCDFVKQDLLNDSLCDLWHYFSVYREPPIQFFCFQVHERGGGISEIRKLHLRPKTIRFDVQVGKEENVTNGDLAKSSSSIKMNSCTAAFFCNWPWHFGLSPCPPGVVRQIKALVGPQSTILKLSMRNLSHQGDSGQNVINVHVFVSEFWFWKDEDFTICFFVFVFVFLTLYSLVLLCQCCNQYQILIS